MHIIIEPWIKIKRHVKWPFSNKKVSKFKRIYKDYISISELHKKLESSYAYYLNEKGKSKDENGQPYNTSNAKYKLAQLDCFIKSSNEQIWAWMTKQKDGTFRDLTFSVRTDFETLTDNNKVRTFQHHPKTDTN